MILMIVGGMLVGAPVKTWVDKLTGTNVPRRHRGGVYVRGVRG